MPCSCKKSSALKTAYTTPSSQQPLYSTNIVVKAQLQSSDSYSFGATTRPDQKCLNCVAKHLGLAYRFLDLSKPQCFIAAGQLMCASSHMRAQNQPVSFFFHNLAYTALKNPSQPDIKKQLKSILESLYEQGQLPTAQSKYIPNISQEYLMRLLKAYSLLFVQTLYEKTNIPWVTAQLAYAAHMQFANYRDIQQYQKLRELWKTIQAIEGYDDAYWRAREGLWGFIQTSSSAGQFQALETKAP